MYKSGAGFPYTYAVLRWLQFGFWSWLVLLAFPLETLAQDPALLECIEVEVARGTNPDEALQLCKDKIFPSPSESVPPTPVSPPTPSPAQNSFSPPAQRLRPGDPLPDQSIYLGGLNGIDANTTDLKIAIGDLPMPAELQTLEDYSRFQALIQQYPATVLEEARQVIRVAEAGELRSDVPMPNNTRRVLWRYLSFRTYGRLIL